MQCEKDQAAESNDQIEAKISPAHVRISREREAGKPAFQLVAGNEKVRESDEVITIPADSDFTPTKREDLHAREMTLTCFDVLEDCENHGE